MKSTQLTRIANPDTCQHALSTSQGLRPTSTNPERMPLAYFPAVDERLAALALELPILPRLRQEAHLRLARQPLA